MFGCKKFGIGSHHFLKRWGILSFQSLFKKLDREIKKFQQATGLKCVEGCGHCCENPHVETTILECLPLAIALWKKKEALRWFDKAKESNYVGRCIFYKPDPLISGRGRCSMYSFRPLVCRLFGFSAIKNKYNKNVLVTCPIIKKLYAKQYARASEAINQDLNVPNMSEYSLRAAQFNSEFGQQFFPINQAVKLAIEKVGLSLQLRSARHANLKK